MISVVVMAHPDRKRWAERLASQLDCPVVWDRGKGIWDTGRRALVAYDPDCTHHLVVQDDVRPAADLLDGLTNCLPHLGDRCLSLYTGKVRPKPRYVAAACTAAEKAGTPWMVLRGVVVWGQAILQPTTALDDLVGWGDRQRLTSYDMRITRWWRNRKVRPRWCHPSLVEHRDPPSLLTGRPKPGTRVSHRFLDGSAADIDWSVPPFEA